MNDEEYRDKISLDDLYHRTQEVDDLRLRVYKKILNRAHQKIKYASRQRNSEHFCFFVVPEFLVGTPRYDSAACIAYIMDKLTNNGFVARYIHPNLLFISWKHWIPSYVRSEIKKKLGYNIDGYGNVVNKKDEDKKKDENPNRLVLNIDKTLSLESKDKHDYKSIKDYTPSGNLVYNKDLFSKIETKYSK